MTSKLISVAIFIVCWALFPKQASAEPTATEVLRMIDQESTIAAAWVQGVTTGMSWMNSELEFNGKERIFCAPEKLAITTDQYIDILRQYLKTDKTVAKMPLGLAVLISLKETFPCSDRKTPSKTP